MKNIHFDYGNPEEFWKAMEHAYKNPATSFADKKILTNKLIAKKINETAWKRLGGDEYLGEKNAFYYNLESRLASIYLKMIRRESVANQVYNNLRDFLKIDISERKGKSETTNQTIEDSQQPYLSLGDMSQGSYGAFKNRSDWLKANRTTANKNQVSEGILEYFERDEKGQVKKDSSGNPIKRAVPALSANWKQIEERGGVGAILNALQFLESDINQELQEIRRDLMNPLSFSEGRIYTDPRTGRVKFKSWEEFEEELEPEEAQRQREIKSFRFDKNLPYQENWKNKLVFLKEELKITRDRDMILKRIGAGENLIEAWDAPIELNTEEEFNKINEEVIGFEEFIEEIKNYLRVVSKKRKSGKQVLPSQRFYLLLGDPGIGKSYIAGMIAQYLGKQFINFNCATAFDTDLIGREQTYRGADFGNIARKMIEGKDRSPVILFDEVDKCRDENVLNIISVLFDDTKNKTDFEDAYLQFPIPMNEVFFLATANDLKRLKEKADFVLSRCTRVKINPLTYKQRIEIAKKSLERNLKTYELEQYQSRITTEPLLKKCLVKELGIRQTKINAKKIADQLDTLDTKYGGNKEENAGKVNIPTDVDLATYEWNGLIIDDGLDPNCPASRGGDHVADHKCFIPDKIPGWIDNMGS
ncbi:MAG: AAA family ATPase [Candidatus Moeniiplasma glomeromycotorum]|nr:AAA family ATPase [Candidatus Moeniiplasma glomeromycotorum]